MGQVIAFTDKTENKLRRSQRSLEELAIDTAGYCAYAYQRGNCGMSVEGLKLIKFMSWSGERIDAIEEFYQNDLLGGKS